MRIKLTLLFVLYSVLGYSQLERNNYTELYLDSILAETKSTFLLYDLSKDNYKVYNKKRAEQVFPVHSTSKILWTLIGLEEGLIANETDIVKWDTIKYAPKEWWPNGFKQDQTIITALQHSVNWYYFELLNLMSPEMIRQYLDAIDYRKGFNVEVVHYFGLTFNIRKSAVEQIDFLKNIYNNSYNLNSKTLETIKKGMLYNKTADYSLYTRKGTGPSPNNKGIAWLIGYVEKDKNVNFFAFNLEAKDEVKAGELRNKYAFKLLKALELME